MPVSEMESQRETNTHGAISGNVFEARLDHHYAYNEETLETI